jgi:hypothetical protein
LGVDEEIPVDELTLDVHPGDRVLICTDGLTSMVDRNRIQKVLEREKDPQIAADKLIDAANKAGGDDNITVIVLDFQEGDGESTAALASDSSRPSADERSRGAPIEAGSAGAPENGESATGVIPVLREEEVREPPRRRPKVRWRRVAVWVAILIALIAAAVIGARAYIGHQWYVGESNGRVAIYNGIPTKVVGFELSHVKENTSLDARQAERLQPWSGLKDGITAESLSDARTIVEQIRRDLQPEGAG